MSPKKYPVMIVEDERISRRALTTLLEDSGYTIQAFASAEELLAEVAHGLRPEMVIADLDLPGKSGLQMLEELERQNPDLRSVLLTAAQADEIDAFCRNHACKYLRKPFNLPHLLSLLRNHRRSQNSRSSS